MNETIGAKGGHNDLRRQLRIREARKKKLKELDEEQSKIRELEKKVRKSQIYTLIKTLPIVLGGGTIQVLYDTAKGKRKIDIEEENSKWRIKEYDQDISPLTQQEFEKKKRKIITTPSGEKVVIYITTMTDEKKDNKVEDKKDGTNKEPSYIRVYEVRAKEQDKSKEKKSTNKKPNISVGSEIVDVESFIDTDLSVFDLSTLSPEAKKNIQLIQSKQLIEGYEKELKEIRYELKMMILEYESLVEQNDKAVLSKEAEVILEKLSELLDKIEKLKQKLRIDNLEQYTGDYINHVIKGYFGELQDDPMIEEIKNSPLFVSLCEKLRELEKNQGKLKDKSEEKKEKLEKKEKDFERLKDKYFSIDKINEQLRKFEAEQEEFLKEIKKKVDESLTVTEKVRIEFQGINHRSLKMIRLLAAQMFLPIPRVATGAALKTAMFTHGMRQLLFPNTKEVPYKLVTVEDYHDDIKSSIDSIEDALSDLVVTSSEIDRLIEMIKTKFKSYIGVVPECNEVLNNLERIKRELKVKEEELEKLKYDQEKELERNDVKVKKRGEYPVN